MDIFKVINELHFNEWKDQLSDISVIKTAQDAVDNWLKRSIDLDITRERLGFFCFLYSETRAIL